MSQNIQRETIHIVDDDKSIVDTVERLYITDSHTAEITDIELLANNILYLKKKHGDSLDVVNSCSGTKPPYSDQFPGSGYVWADIYYKVKI
jgi:hypothetical protein